jgi:hypothetical protein
VIFEIFALALVSTVRPTSLAAVYALVSHDQRLRLMCAYVVAGLAFTLGFGAIVVGVFHGIHVRIDDGTTKAVTDMVGGALVLVFGVAVVQGRVGGGQSGDAPKPERRLQAMVDRRLTVRTAALAGPLTHVPGVFYLVAPNLIVAHNVGVSREIFALVVYNAVWFAVPIAALVVCVVSPTAARSSIASIQHWTHGHARKILLVTSFVLGAALVLRGLIAL